MALLGVAALGAVFAFVGAVGATVAAGPETRVVESWRTYGFLVFAGLFVLLALRPRLYPRVWELVILHKSATALTAASLLGSAADAPTVAVVDGILAAMIIAAYLLARGYAGWTRLLARDTGGA
jgi:hypothetical protein